MRKNERPREGEKARKRRRMPVVDEVANEE